jgi:hypothetical protein
MLNLLSVCMYCFDVCADAKSYDVCGQVFQWAKRSGAPPPLPPALLPPPLPSALSTSVPAASASVMGPPLYRHGAGGNQLIESIGSSSSSSVLSAIDRASGPTPPPSFSHSSRESSTSPSVSAAPRLRRIPRVPVAASEEKGDAMWNFAPASRPLDWACEICTYENPIAVLVCEMCGASGPSGQASPIDRKAEAGDAVGAADDDFDIDLTKPIIRPSMSSTSTSSSYAARLSTALPSSSAVLARPTLSGTLSRIDGRQISVAAVSAKSSAALQNRSTPEVIDLQDSQDHVVDPEDEASKHGPDIHAEDDEEEIVLTGDDDQIEYDDEDEAEDESADGYDEHMNADQVE